MELRRHLSFPLLPSAPVHCAYMQPRSALYHSKYDVTTYEDIAATIPIAAITVTTDLLLVGVESAPSPWTWRSQYRPLAAVRNQFVENDQKV